MDKLVFRITNENGNIGGIMNTSHFDPLTILGDILSVSKGFCNDENCEKIAEEFKHFFGILDKSFDESEIFEYFEKMRMLRNMIYCNKYLSLSEFERLKSFFNLKFHFDIVPYEHNGWSEQDYLAKNVLRFGFADIADVFENELNNEHIFFYTCYSMEDVVFSVLHYLILNEYKFRQCEHCEKYFATKTFKQKYCTRKSPLEQHSNLECRKAVDHIMKKIKKSKKAIMTNIGNNYPKADIPFTSEFDAHFLKDGKPAKCSWYMLESLEEITSRKYRKKWYKLECKK